MEAKSEEKSSIEDKGCKAGAKPSRDAAIVDKVRSWMFSNQEFEDEVQMFIKDSAELIDDIEEQEMKLQYTQLHQRFIELFESRATAFIEREGSTIIDVYHALQEMSRDESTEEAAFVDAMMSFVDFETFMVLLRETKRGHPWSLESMFSP
jgi:hypothetical protein